MTNIFKGIGAGKCLICGTSKKGPVLLIPVDGTREGNIEAAEPVHVECLNLRISKKTSQGSNIIYQEIEAK